MATRDSEEHLSEAWHYEPAPGKRRRGRLMWQVAEVSALLAGVFALGIALTAPLAWVSRSDAEIVADREARAGDAGRDAHHAHGAGAHRQRARS